MAFCSRCGQEILEDAVFCPGCGAEVGSHFSNNQDSERKAYTSYTHEEKNKSEMFDDIGEKAQEFGKKAADAFNEINDTPDYSESYSADDIANNKALAILSYFNLLVLIPIFVGKNSRFATFHANQGLILAIAQLALWIVNIFLGWIGLIRLAKNLLSLVIAVFAIIGIVNAAQGKAKELPLIGGINFLKR